MDILVNGQEIDFDLQENIALTKVLEHLQEWASKDSMFVLDYKVNGENSGLANQSLMSSQINTLEIELGDQSQLVYSHLEELTKYVNKVGNFIAGSIQKKKPLDISAIAEIDEGLTWIIDSLQGLQRYFEGYNIQNELLVLEEKQGNIAQNLPEILEGLISIRNTVELWSKSYVISNLNEEEATEVMQGFVLEIAQQTDILEQIATDLTAGNEKKALALLETIMQWISDGILIMNKSGFQPDLLKKLNETMNEVAESLNDNDFVTLADIIDYDLKDILNELAAA
ncbi:MAG: hypothetical protein ABUK01_06865 [Leptospirales bacterium]